MCRWVTTCRISQHIRFKLTWLHDDPSRRAHHCRRSQLRILLRKFFINFSPAISDKAVKAIRAEIRSWDLHLRSDKRIEDLSRMFNPKIRGWLQYYGRYYRSACIRRCANWIGRWPAGLSGNTRNCTVIYAGRRIPERGSG